MKKIIDFRTGEQINIIDEFGCCINNLVKIEFRTGRLFVIDEFELDITERVKIEKVR